MSEVNSVLHETPSDEERAEQPPASARTLTRLLHRQGATFADERTTLTIDLALWWRELTSGACRVVDSYWSESRCFVLTAARMGMIQPVDERRMRLLEAVLLASAQKAVAIDMGVSPSTVASGAGHALRTLGVQLRPSRTHPLLVLAAREAHTGRGSAKAALSFIAQGDQRLRVVSIPRPDLCLASALSRAEYDVARSLVEGLSNEEIARRRGTSQRTVANQVASVFRELRVSGRGELLHWLLSRQGAGES